MKHLLTAFIATVLSLTVLVSVHAEEKVYDKEERTFKDGYFYHKETDERINGIVKIGYQTGELKGEGEIPVKDGLKHGVAKYYAPAGILIEDRTYHEGNRHGISKVYNKDGSLLAEEIFENNRLISGYWPEENGEKKAFSKAMIENYNATLPHPFAKKEAEAVKKIQVAIESIEKPEYDENLRKQERIRIGVEFFSRGFEKAGYNYFETIKQVADDMKNHPERIPPKGESRHKMIIMLMALQKSECEYQKVDCLQFYPSDTREAVQWLWKKTGWSI